MVWYKSLDNITWADMDVTPTGHHSLYVQLFRTGIVEIGSGGFVQKTDSGSKQVHALRLDKLLIESCSRFVPRLRELGILSPLSIFISLCGVKGCRALKAHTHPFLSTESDKSYDRDIVAPPEIQMEGVSKDWGQELRPLCDLIWQASGWDRSPFFDKNGHWIGGGLG